MRRWLLSLRASSKSSNKGRERNTNTAQRGFATGVVSLVIILLNVHMQMKMIGTMTRKGRRRWKRKSITTRRKVVRRTWEGSGTHDESSTDSSSDEDTANIAINKGILFPNIGHKCLMAKESKNKKVYSKDTPNILLPMMRVALLKK
jgi:hypothetical protein